MNLQGDVLLLIVCLISTLLRYCTAFGWRDGYRYSLFSKVPTSSQQENVDTGYRKLASLWSKYHFWRRRRGIENDNTPILPSVSKLYKTPVKRYFHFSPFFLKTTVEDSDKSKEKQKLRTDKKTKSVNMYNSVAELWKIFRPDQYSDSKEFNSQANDNSKAIISKEDLIQSLENDNGRNIFPDDLISYSKQSENPGKELLRPQDNKQNQLRRNQAQTFNENNLASIIKENSQPKQNIFDDISLNGDSKSQLVGRFDNLDKISIPGETIANLPKGLHMGGTDEETEENFPLDPIHQRAVGTPLGIGSHINSPDGLYDPGYEPIKTKLFVSDKNKNADSVDLDDFGGFDYDYGFDDASYGYFPDYGFGEGYFDNDESGCDGIETRVCTTDSECSCFGIFFCIEGSCQMKGATPTKDTGDLLGTWLEEPIQED